MWCANGTCHPPTNQQYSAINLGLNDTTREGSAGIIGYKVFGDQLDIMGAGTSANYRTVKVWDNLTVVNQSTGFLKLQ
jgi:hypothetical protein